MIETDEMLYSRFLADHHEADFRVLLERHRESLTLFLYGYVHNLEDAEELMLDTYAEAAAGAVFYEKSSFKTWLFPIGKKKSLVHLRKRHLFIVELKEAEELSSDTPELEILRDKRNRQLYQALRELKQEYRQILILLYFEEMSHEEAAKVMKKTKKQIYHLAERGRKALRENLERMGFEYAQYG